MQIQKKGYLLFEMCIALALSGMLLSTLFSSYISFYRVDARLKAAKNLLLERGECFTTLQKMFLSIPAAVVATNSPKPFYKHEEKDRETLIFIFDAGAHPSPAFSGPLYGSLLIDDQQDLCLLVWPLEKESQLVRKLPLIHQVDRLHFEFFVEENENFFWKDTPDSDSTPSMVRISFLQENVPISFAFFLPMIDPIIPGDISA